MEPPAHAKDVMHGATPLMGERRSLRLYLCGSMQMSWARIIGRAVIQPVLVSGATNVYLSGTFVAVAVHTAADTDFVVRRFLIVGASGRFRGG